jgi:hypothetical protein
MGIVRCVCRSPGAVSGAGAGQGGGDGEGEGRAGRAGVKRATDVFQYVAVGRGLVCVVSVSSANKLPVLSLSLMQIMSSLASARRLSARQARPV